MTAIGVAFAPLIVTDGPDVHSGFPREGCDFSGDGRLVDGLAADRSALACPVFYAAVLICPLLILAVAVIRLFRALSGPWTSVS